MLKKFLKIPVNYFENFIVNKPGCINILYIIKYKYDFHLGGDYYKRRFYCTDY